MFINKLEKYNNDLNTVFATIDHFFRLLYKEKFKISIHYLKTKLPNGLTVSFKSKVAQKKTEEQNKIQW